jgi:hypothetical protein
MDVVMTKPEEWPGIYGALRGVSKAEIYGMVMERKEKREKDKAAAPEKPPEERVPAPQKDKTDKKSCPKGKKGKDCAPAKEPAKP